MLLVLFSIVGRVKLQVFGRAPDMALSMMSTESILRESESLFRAKGLKFGVW